MATNGRELNRAERFDDEKRRIVESCFNKKDEDGSVLETYITHIRILEFSTHPTSPPPPQARTPQSQKPRVIIVAVRKSGRVRVHKSKENPNGSFSIGKTWNLDDLTALESFTGPGVSPNLRDWAGEVGFIISLGKPYYWQAQSDKEKKFFIASLIKIYGKYTNGRMPELTNFDQREIDQVLGGAQAARKPVEQTIPRRPAPPDASSSNLSASSGLNGNGNLAPRPTTADRGSSRSPMMMNGSASPSASIDSSRSQEMAPLRRLASNNKSQDSVAASLATKSDDGSLRPRSRNGVVNGGSAYTTPEPPPPPPPVNEPPPERKRPPMDPLRPQSADRDLVPAPLMSPAMRREPMVPPRSVDRMSPRKNSTNRRPEPIGDRIVANDVSRDPASVTSPLAETPISANSTTSPPPGTETPVESPVEPAQEDIRPGLGPMIKAKKSKGDVAGAFWKAASAASAFRPRPGGAADRLRNLNKSNEGPDGITEVVPAPPRPVSSHKTPEPTTPTPEPPPKAADRTSALPEVKVTVPNSSRPTSLEAPPKEVKNAEAEAKEEARKSIITGNDAKYLASLGIDPAVLDNRSTEFGKWLDYFSWVPGDQMRAKNYDEMKIDMERELNKAQAGGWLARFQEEDERVDLIKKGIDVAITECEELDNLLTLYSVELSTLSDDIAYIEAQGQGLQVQAANQKLLMKELESLIETCAISESDLDALKVAPLESLGGIEEIEAALVTLFKAMNKIDPAMGTADARKSEDESGDQSSTLNSDYGKMRIVQEKKEMYVAESKMFMRRLVEFMARQFEEASRATRGALESALTKKVDTRNHDAGRDLLWMYSPLILYARDADLDNWNRILQVYQDKSYPIYKAEFKEAMEVWKKNAKKPTGEESELLFTSLQEKKEEGIATTARKLTVKRSQTLARTLRSPLGDGSRSNIDKVADSRALPYEVFAGVLDDLLPLVEMEQNFIIDFFHATSLEQMDFPDIVALSRPRERRGNDLKRHRLMEPDRELARRVTRAMEVIFSFLEPSIQQLIDWVLGSDPLQGIGVLAALERKMADMSQSNQDFLNSALQRLHGALESKFKKFVDDQVRAIEETKVKIKKRKGVIGFMRIFPQFSAAVEAMLAGVDPHLPIRRMVDREYDRILKSMFDSLKVIARENPAVSVANISSSNSADPEDKEALNFHILLIENMNHYLEEVDGPRSIEVLDEWKEQAQNEMAEHMGLYLNAVMRRPLGKLLETLENIEAQLNNGKSPSAIAAQPSNSKAVFNKVLGAYDAREVRKGIETLRKRVEKHFGDADEPALAKPLVNRVLKECERFYGNVEMRIGAITTDVYGGDVLFEWPRAEVKSAFSTVGR
ncbi:hypothetical protein GQ53DRAFT_844066 [Thozetella sp. PMI_491]|nr:hypothetical protein GQ53DRAFT_844066 [Thozetella sp. PMI_491]